MTIDDFLDMDEMEQAEAIWTGTVQGFREENEYRIVLYKIDQFYVEIYYHKEHNVIKKFRPFDDPRELQLYANLN